MTVRPWPVTASHNLLRPDVIVRKLRSLRFHLRTLAGRGALPNALIVGAPKCGTTSLFDWLVRHPQIDGSRTKEVQYFDTYFAKGERWYRAHFPADGRAVRLEASPNYLFHPRAPDRAASLVPQARLIVLLRHPVDRAWSHYQQNRSVGRESRSFERAVDEELAELGDAMNVGRAGLVDDSYHYLAKGFYARHLARWASRFGSGRMLVLKAEDMFAEPQRTVDEVTDFLGLDRQPMSASTASNRGSYPPLSPALRRRLEQLFDRPNRELEPVGIRWGDDTASDGLGR